MGRSTIDWWSSTNHEKLNKWNTCHCLPSDLQLLNFSGEHMKCRRQYQEWILQLGRALWIVGWGTESDIWKFTSTVPASFTGNETGVPWQWDLGETYSSISCLSSYCNSTRQIANSALHFWERIQGQSTAEDHHLTQNPPIKQILCWIKVECQSAFSWQGTSILHGATMENRQRGWPLGMFSNFLFGLEKWTLTVWTKPMWYQ